MQRVPSLPFRLAIEGKGWPDNRTSETDQEALQPLPPAQSSSAESARLGMVLIFQIILDVILLRQNEEDLWGARAAPGYRRLRLGASSVLPKTRTKQSLVYESRGRM